MQLAYKFTNDLGILSFISFFGIVVFITIKAASLFAKEKSQQTLNVLFTLPLNTRDILQQKTESINRLIYIGAVPLLFFIVIKFFFLTTTSQPPHYYRSKSLLYLVCAVPTMYLCLFLIKWVMIWIGLKAHSYNKAILTSLATLLAWILFVPLLVAIVFNSPFLVMLSSPMFAVLAIEFGEVSYRLGLAGPIFVNTMWYAGIMFFFQNLCLTQCNEYLGRRD